MALCYIAMTVALFLAVAALGDSDIAQRRPKPTWPDSYEVKYNFTLPYMQHIQRHGLRYPVHYWRDAANGRMRLHTYEGETMEIYASKLEYQVHPERDQLVCAVWEMEDGSPLMGREPLPNLEAKGWYYNGIQDFQGSPAAVWAYEHWVGEKHVMHWLYTSVEGDIPLRWHQHGRDEISGAHFDEWILDYTHFKAGVPNDDAFSPPKHCDGVKPKPSGGPTGFRYRATSLMPALKFARDDEYDAFALQHGRSHVSEVDYELRKQVYHYNKQFVEEWNAKPASERSHTVALNKFADWTDEEFEAIMLPRRASRRAGSPMPARSPGQHALQHPPKELDATRVPSEVDWSGTPAEGPTAVKDQATCGSCWAFAAVGAATGAYYVATGNSVDLSQQQLVDCSWPFGNDGCDGGYHDQALEYVVQVGGMAALDAYEYAGQDRFCRDNSTSKAVQLKGYVNLPEGDVDAVREAVYSRGPLAVAIDAAQPSFKFYASGVFYEPNCGWQEDDLDHAVVLVGYGKAEDGDGYWLIRNSWSAFWGDNGYVRISTRGHGCGVATQAMYAVVDTPYTAQEDANNGSVAAADA